MFVAHIHNTFMHLADAFIQSDLHLIIISLFPLFKRHSEFLWKCHVIIMKDHFEKNQGKRLNASCKEICPRRKERDANVRLIGMYKREKIRKYERSRELRREGIKKVKKIR